MQDVTMKPLLGCSELDDLLDPVADVLLGGSAVADVDRTAQPALPLLVDLDPVDPRGRLMLQHVGAGRVGELDDAADLAGDADGRVLVLDVAAMLGDGYLANNATSGGVVLQRLTIE